MKDCEYLHPSFGCRARDHAKELMLQELIEGSGDTEFELCKEQCCEGCTKSCGYRCGRCYKGMYKENSGGRQVVIKEMRMKAGMTLKEFSEFTGVPTRTIQNWEAQAGSRSARKCPEYIVSLIRYKLEKEGKI